MPTFTPTWLMIKRHPVTGFKYFCKTTREDPLRYKRSGTRWTAHLRQHGRIVETLWCKQFTTEAELKYCALTFSAENQISYSAEWANLEPEDGISGRPKGMKLRPATIEKCRKNAKGFKKGCTPWNKGILASVELSDKRQHGRDRWKLQNPVEYQKTINNLISTPYREAKRIKAVKKRMAGANNWNYDPTVYTFTSKHTGVTVSATRNEMIHKYKCQPQNLYRVIQGKGKSVNGWVLGTI